MPTKKKSTIKKSKKIKSIRKPAKKKNVKKTVSRKRKSTGKRAKPKAVKRESKKRSSKKFSGKRVRVKAVQDVITAPVIKEATLIMSEDYMDPFANFEFKGQIQNDNQDYISDSYNDSEDVEYVEPVESGFLSYRQKHIIMYVAIASIMIIVVGFWFVGIRSSLSKNLANQDLIGMTNSEEDERLRAALENFGKELNAIGEEMINTEEDIADLVEQGQIEFLKQQIKNNAIDQTKEKLENFNKIEENSSQ